MTRIEDIYAREILDSRGKFNWNGRFGSSCY